MGSSLSEARRSTAARSRWLSFTVRVTIGGGILGFILARSDLARIGRAIAEARILFLVVALFLAIGILVLGAFRWQAYLRPLGMTLAPGTLVRLYFVGMFFNAFLPTGVGGDAYKVMQLRRRTGSLGRPLASVLLDRLAGTVGLALIGMVAASSRVLRGDTRPVVLVAVLLSIGTVLGSLGVLWLGERFSIGKGETDRLILWGRVRLALGAVAKAGRDPHAALQGLGLGVITQAVVLVAVALLTVSLGMVVPLDALAVVVVVATIAASLPATINGLGFREGAYVWGLGSYGVPHDSALALALLVLGLLLASSLVGGAVYVLAGGDMQGQ